ncbi:hypothetical protein R1sor_016715 [Riccia sorocarpa]|uniref:Uncharacterized protein n=1 Tax=Riccia sorocarpa TaxID=122646 RepID=A0ABD3HHP4_9MARC
MLKFVPKKGEKAILEEASSSDKEDATKKKKKTKKKNVEYKLTLDEQFNCELVFLDLTHPNLVSWGKPEFSTFMGIVKDLTVAKEFMIVFVMDFGRQLVDFTSALKEMKGVFTREALMLSRDIIYFASSQLEAELMTKYNKMLVTLSKRTKEWFGAYLSNAALARLPSTTNSAAEPLDGRVQEEAPHAVEQIEQEHGVTIAGLALFVVDGNLANAALEQLVQPYDRNVTSQPLEEVAVLVTVDNAADDVLIVVGEGRFEDNAVSAVEEGNQHISAQIARRISGEKQAIQKSQNLRKRAEVARKFRNPNNRSLDF